MPKDIHLLIKNLREKKSMTIRALAKYSKIHYTTITRFESGMVTITLNQLAALAEILDFKLDFVELDPKKKIKPNID